MKRVIAVTKRLYLMRHAETQFNLRYLFQGWCDSSLTQRGRAQARIAGQYFVEEQIPLDHAYSSDLRRASETCELAVGEVLPHDQLAGLREWNFGAFEGTSGVNFPVQFPYGDFFGAFGGETQEELEARVIVTLQDIMERPAHSNVLAVSSGDVCTLFCNLQADHSPVQIDKRAPNCGIYVYDYDEGIFSCQGLIEPDFSSLGPAPDHI